MGVSDTQSDATMTGAFAELLGFAADVLAMLVDRDGMEKVDSPAFEGRPVVGAFLGAGVVEVRATVLDVEGSLRRWGGFLPS